MSGLNTGIDTETAKLDVGLEEKEKGELYDGSVDKTSEDDGLEHPTEEDLATLEKVPDEVPWSAFREYLLQRLLIVLMSRCSVISFVEMAERFSYL